MPELHTPEELLAVKIGLMVDGMHVDQEVWSYAQEKHGSPDITTRDYASTGGIIVNIGELEGNGVYVNAPFQRSNPNFVTITPYRLSVGEGGLELHGRKFAAEVKMVPVASYLNKPNSHGGKHRKYGVTHGDRVRISPVRGCSMTCDFCDIPFTSDYDGDQYDGVEDPDTLIETVRAALEDPVRPAKRILASGGTPRRVHYGKQLEVYERIPEAFPDTHFDIMMVPMPGLIEPDHLQNIGVNTLCLNLELFNPDRARAYMKNKFKASRPFFLDRIEGAVKVFGPGKVRSLLLVGLEPLEDTLQGVEELAKRGCDPVLSPFRPDPKTPLKDVPPPSEELLHEAYKRSREIVSRYRGKGVLLGPRFVMDQHNTLTLPVDI